MDAIKWVIIGVFGILILKGHATAEDYAHISTYRYTIRPGPTITKSIFSIGKDLSLETGLTVRFAVDHIEDDQGVDAVSGATRYAGEDKDNEDTRKEITIGLSHKRGAWTIETGYVASVEKDYRSQTPYVSISRDLFQRNTTLTIGYAHNFDEVHGSYMPISRDRDVDNYSFSLTQVLGRKTIMQIGYTFSDAIGYMGTGNRRVTLINNLVMDEYLPERRRREAVGIRVAQWLPTEGSIQLSYRYYRDDWKIDSNTYQIQINQYLSDSLLVRMEYRLYEQSAAFFVKDSYTGAERYMTSANSLKAFSSNLYGIKLLYTLRKDWDWDMEAKYERYDSSNDIEVDIFMLGMRVLF